MKIIKNLLLGCMALVAFSACNNNEADEAMIVESESTLALHISHSFGNEAFQLEQNYAAENGATVNFTELRYWISNVELVHENGTKYQVPNSYYLIQHMKEQLVQDTFTLPDSVRETVVLQHIPEGTYTGINFSVGVDPVYNDDLTRTAGELNALQNMAYSSWMWFTSYIFTKAKGYVVYSEETMGFTFETGSNDCFRTVSISLENPVTVSEEVTSELTVNNDVAKLFSDISFDAALMTGTQYVIGATKPDLMMKLSDNYRAAFSAE